MKGKHSAKSLEDLEKYTASRVSKQGKMIFETDGMVLIGGITSKVSRGKAVSEEESLRTARKKIKHFLSQVRLASGSHAQRRLRPLPRPQRELQAGGHDLHPTGETPCEMTRKCAPLQDYGKALLMFRRRDAYQDGTVTRGDFKDVLGALSVGLTDAQERFSPIPFPPAKCSGAGLSSAGGRAAHAGARAGYGRDPRAALDGGHYERRREAEGRLRGRDLVHRVSETVRARRLVRGEG